MKCMLTAEPLRKAINVNSYQSSVVTQLIFIIIIISISILNSWMTVMVSTNIMNEGYQPWNKKNKKAKNAHAKYGKF